METRSDRTRPTSGFCRVLAVEQRDRYVVRTPSTGREAAVEGEPDQIYVDAETGETMLVVSKLTPVAPSPSKLPWSVETLRLCGCNREQFVQNDVNDCPYCSKRLNPVE